MMRKIRDKPVGEPTPESDIDSQKPPRDTRFRKGQSGNPSGRPRKAKAKPKPSPSNGATQLNPLQAIVLAEAQRQISLREGGREIDATMLEAIIRSVGVNAVKGGVLHSRTFMNVVIEAYAVEQKMRAEQESRREESYRFWSDYCARERAEMADTLRDGQAVPDPLPHPDDIRFDAKERIVTFLGPIDEEQLELTRKLLAMRDLLYELMVFSEEKACIDVHGRFERIGLIGIFLQQVMAALPPRLHPIPKQLEDRIYGRCGSRWLWAAQLTEEAAALGLPFRPTQRRGEMRTFTLDELEVEYHGDLLVPKDSAERRKYKSKLVEAGVDLDAVGFYQRP